MTAATIDTAPSSMPAPLFPLGYLIQTGAVGVHRPGDGGRPRPITGLRFDADGCGYEYYVGPGRPDDAHGSPRRLDYGWVSEAELLGLEYAPAKSTPADAAARAG